MTTTGFEWMGTVSVSGADMPPMLLLQPLAASPGPFAVEAALSNPVSSSRRGACP
jgi:hypothetical protein